MKYARSAIIFIVIAACIIWLSMPRWTAPPQAASVQPAAASNWGAGQSNPFGPAQAARAPRVQSTAPPALSVDLSKTSLAGTQPDGQWVADVQGQLRKDFALRQRLDYFLTLLGEQPLDQLRALVQQKARAELPEPAHTQLMHLWDRYVQLQQHAFKSAVDLRQPSGWSAALLERQAVRRSVLGADVAHAFYAQEERELQEMIARVNDNAADTVSDGRPTPPEQAQPLVAQLPDAQERQAQVEREWRQWDQRIEAARAQVQRLQAAPELSPVQRQSAVQQVLVSQFQEGSERLRAASLLGL